MEWLLFFGECALIVFAICGVATAIMLHDVGPAPQWAEDDEFYRNRWYK